MRQEKQLRGFRTENVRLPSVHPRRGGRGVIPEKFGGGVWPASQNPYPIYDQNLRHSLPYLQRNPAITKTPL